MRAVCGFSLVAAITPPLAQAGVQGGCGHCELDAPPFVILERFGTFRLLGIKEPSPSTLNVLKVSHATVSL